jgi:hypothetical protein
MRKDYPMDSTDAADLISDLGGESEVDRFRNRAALLIAVLAAVLAISGLGGGNATDDMVASNIKASDTWAFYQAKNVRQNLYTLQVEDLKADLASGAVPAAQRAATEERIKSYEARIARYESEPDAEAPNDPLKGEGKKELSAQAKAQEAAFEVANARDFNFDLAEVLLQLSLVLGSVAILAARRWVLITSAVVGAIGAALTLNGFLLLVPLG